MGGGVGVLFFFCLFWGFFGFFCFFLGGGVFFVYHIYIVEIQYQIGHALAQDQTESSVACIHKDIPTILVSSTCAQ